MLGWSIKIYPQSFRIKDIHTEVEDILVSWKTGLGGLDWIENLCSEGEALSLGGNGYPLEFAITARALFLALEEGVPAHKAPLVIGDDYISPSGWTDQVEIDLERLIALPPELLLAVDAWDMS